MSTITVILDPSSDGTVHLPVPEHLRNGKVKVVATMEEARATEKSETPLGALKELRKLGAFKSITDPVAWQREQRRDRSLPGRD